MTLWVRTPVLDEFGEGDEGVVLLTDGRVLALAPTAWTLLQELGVRPADATALRNVLVEEFGIPTDDEGNDISPEMVTDLLNVLHAQDLVAPEGSEGPG